MREYPEPIYLCRDCGIEWTDADGGCICGQSEPARLSSIMCFGGHYPEGEWSYQKYKRTWVCRCKNCNEYLEYKEGI
jgi:hypothetical protein